MRISDWSSDVCSSDLLPRRPRFASPPDRPVERAEREGFAQHVMVAKGGVLARVAGIAGHEQHRQFGPALFQLRDHFGAGEFGHQHVRSEEHTSELQSLMRISYAVLCLKKKQQPT